MIYVLYDGPECIDGFGSAFAFWLKHRWFATYLPVEHDESFKFPAPLQPGDEVYIIDTAFPRETLLEWKRICKVILLDHHKSSQELLGDLDFCHFDMTKSGCVLAFEYVNKHYTDNGIKIVIPRLLQHIQDRDLWKFELKDTEAVTTALIMVEKNFELWETFQYDNIFDSVLLEPGRVIIKHKNSYIKERLAHTELITNSLGDTVPIINSTIHISELGDAMCKKYPDAPYVMILTVNSFSPLKFKVSLRSRSTNGADVSIVARHFGGGGHKNSSGFHIKNLDSILSSGTDYSF